MEVGKLTVQHRTKTGKGVSRSTRRAGDVPGVCYGAGMEAPIAVSISPKALRASLDPKRRRNTIIDVTIEGGSSPIDLKAMLWDFQIDPIRQNITHVDLKSIDPDQALETEVPVVATGTHRGAIEGGLLSWARHSVDILAKPGNIPTELALDITPLGMGDTLHVGDLPLPEGVSFATSTKLTIVTCIAPKGMKSDKQQAEEEAAAEGEGEEAKA